MAEKLKQVGRYWGGQHKEFKGYGAIDIHELRPFNGSHPKLMEHWIELEAETEFLQDPDYQVTFRDLRNRIRFWIEDALGVEISKKHYRSLD